MKPFSERRFISLLSIAVLSLVLSACGGGGGDAGGGSTPPATYTVSVAVSGLAGSGLVLQNNGSDDLSVSTDGNVTFATAIADGSAYNVTVLTQPSIPNQICTVANGSGTVVGGAVSNVSIACVAATYTVGVTVSGLTGTGLVLQNNGGDDLSISADGSVTFATAIADGGAYAVTVLTQPTGQTCAVTNGNGTIAGAAVSNVVVQCPWTKQMGAVGVSTYGQSVATDSRGNVYVAGYTAGGLDGNTRTGTNDFFVTKYDSAGTKLYTRQLGVSGAVTWGNSVATDINGNVYVAGTTAGGLDGKTLTGAEDFYVTKYNSAGTKLYTRQLGGVGLIVGGVSTSYTGGQSVATDVSGNVYVAGYTYGIALDGKTVTGVEDFYVTKYNSAGTRLYTRLLGVAGTYTKGNSVATDASGNVYVVGNTKGSLDGKTLTGVEDFFVTKYNSAGTRLYTRLLGVAGTYTQGNSVATDANGNVYVAGQTYGGLGGNTLTGIQDFFVTKYNSAGTRLYTKQLGVTGKSTVGTSIATDASGNVYVAGYTTGGLDGNTLTGTRDFFVTKYDSAGTKLYTRQLGVSGAVTWGNSVATDTSGNVYVAGYTTGGLDGNTLTGTQDFFVTKYDGATGAKQ